MACPHFHFMNECRHKVCRLWKGVVITMKIPQHVAIILDGNGRWAKSKGMPRNYGHTVGAKNVEIVCMLFRQKTGTDRRERWQHS